jgi:hypothetical protein
VAKQFNLVHLVTTPTADLATREQLKVNAHNKISGTTFWTCDRVAILEFALRRDCRATIVMN